MHSANSDQLRVALFPGEAVFVRLARGLRMRTVAKGIIDLSAGSGGDISWRRAIEGMRAAMPRLGLRPALVHVVLSNHFARYAVLPSNYGRSATGQRERHVRHYFREVHGAAADNWHVREIPARDGMGRLAFAIDRELLDELTAIFGTRPLRLGSVQPLLVAAFSEFRSTLGNAGYFLLHEPGGLCGGTYADGEWKSLKVTRLPGDASVAAAVERHVEASDIAHGTSIYLYMTGADSVPGGRLAVQHQLQILQPPRRAGAAYGMALLGSPRPGAGLG